MCSQEMELVLAQGPGCKILTAIFEKSFFSLENTGHLAGADRGRGQQNVNRQINPTFLPPLAANSVYSNTLGQTQNG